MRDPRANYKQSLKVLRHVKRIQPNMVTKSSLMLGLGETDDEVLQAMKGNSQLIFQLPNPKLVSFFQSRNLFFLEDYVMPATNVSQWCNSSYSTQCFSCCYGVESNNS